MPFAAGDPRTVEAARKGGEARRARAAGKRADASALRALTRKACDSYDRAELGPLAGALAADIMARLLTGEIRLRSADVAPTVRALVDIVRLESGEPTSAALVAHVSAADVAERVGALQRQARAALAIVPARDGDGLGGEVGAGSEPAPSSLPAPVVGDDSLPGA